MGTPRTGHGVETMGTTMTKKTLPPNPFSRAMKAKPVVARSGRRLPRTKKEIAIALLERSKGASIAEMQRAMGWQEHSVRGFLAATVKKMPGVTLISEKAENGPRRYRIEAAGE
jgi:hypothetical protein